MRTTVTLDDELVDKAMAYSGITERSELIRHALKTLVELEASRRLARLGGTMPDIKPVPRRRSTAA
jgi:Arc/MetJ family transcription regulator